MNDLVYSVNKEARVVECTVQNCKHDFMRITEKILAQYPQHIRHFYKFITAYRCEEMIKDEYVGKSVCSPADVFNERYGCDIARTKAIMKRENAFQSALEVIADDIMCLMDINNSIDRMNILAKHACNLYDMLETEKTLADIKGWDVLEDKPEYTPHCCSLCDKTFVNYTDDVDYWKHENEWVVLRTKDHRAIEMCTKCANALVKLRNI